jgi:outer membrane protein OmpA-like peptidoglycan-associated protein
VTPASGLPVSVFFDVGRSDLSANGQRAIQSVAVTVKSSQAPVAVTGYADSSGNPDQNEELAKNRAAAVRDELVRDGVSPSLIVLVPPAAVTPGAPADQSRRVDIKVAEASDTASVVR